MSPLRWSRNVKWTRAGLSVDVDDPLLAFLDDPNLKIRAFKQYKSTIRQDLKQLLDLLALFNAKGTFFIPGYILQEAPDLLDVLADTEHEIASHGCKHRFLTQWTAEEFEQDISQSIQLIRKYSGRTVSGYRAPGLTLAPVAKWAVPILLKYHFTYSSSTPSLPARQHNYLLTTKQPFYWEGGLLEIPLSSHHNIPVCGSFYSRIIPHKITQYLTRRYIRDSYLPLFYYCHPFEVFPEHNSEATQYLPAVSKLYFMNCDSYVDKLKWFLAEQACDTYANIIRDLKAEKAGKL